MNNSASSDPNSSLDRNAKRRRLEADSIMYQSDAAKLLREEKLLEVEYRTLAREIATKQVRLDEIGARRKIISEEIEGVNAELARLRKSINQF